MKPFFSIITTQTNHFSGEQISLGLIFITPEKVFFKFSPAKLNWLKKLNTGIDLYLLVEDALNKIQKITQEHNKNPNLFLGKTFSVDYFEYLHQYAIGAVAFTEPKPLNIDFNQEVFEKYFTEIIGVTELVKKIPKINFNHKVKNIFKVNQVQDNADVDYSLEANKFAGILKDTKLSLITKNGSVQALEIIDFKQTENTLISHLYESEIIYKSLLKFCKHEGLEMAKLKFAFDKPEKENSDLFNLVYKEKKDLFDFMELPEVTDFVTEVATSGNYKKFSEFFS